MIFSLIGILYSKKKLKVERNEKSNENDLLNEMNAFVFSVSRKKDCDFRDQGRRIVEGTTRNNLSVSDTFLFVGNVLYSLKRNILPCKVETTTATLYFVQHSIRTSIIFQRFVQNLYCASGTCIILERTKNMPRKEIKHSERIGGSEYQMR